MKEKIVFFCITALLICFVTSCASSTYGQATSIEEAHPERLDKTYIGMGVDEFKTIWPEATRSGMSEGKETYVFIYAHMFIYASDFKIHTYFHFVDNKLVGYDSEQKSPLVG